jgi:citrate/tricarballylate utilization protein
VPPVDLIREGERIMTICNACRYCEGFCAVFPAMEERRTFAEADMNYLANLCHNCTECLHACQYAPPHPFAVNVPMTLAKIRLRSYEKYCWPQALGSAFRLHGVPTVVGIAGVLIACMLGAAYAVERPLMAADRHGDFYGVVPHGVMVGAFGAAFLLVVTAMVVGVARYVKETGTQRDASEPRHIVAGLRDALTLKYLHGSGDDCTVEENARGPWRRWFHHLTFYGFLLCFASTTVAAGYHLILGWKAPYPFLSVPVLLGTIGGIGLVVGPIGLWAVRNRRDPAATDSEQDGLDRGFILLLVLTSATGLTLLAFRDSAAMGALLIVHLAFVLTCFVMLPYGKFVHGLYRAAALVQYARESRAAAADRSSTAA